MQMGVAASRLQPVKQEDGTSVLLAPDSEEDGDGYEEAVLEVQGVLMAFDLPPVLYKRQ